MVGKAGKSVDFEEKKEKFLRGASKSSGKNRGEMPPVYFIGMLLVLGLLAGAALTVIYISPAKGGGQQNPGTDTNELVYRTVPITMVYSSDCKTCATTNTVEDVFRVRKIPYALQKVEASSPKGKDLIARFGIDRVPTAVIDASKVAFYPATKKDFDGVFQKKQGYYIAPELNLNQKTYLPVYYLSPLAGLCDANSAKPTVVQFDDYYTGTFVDSRKDMYAFSKDFNQSIDWKYSFAQSVSTDTNSVYANLYLTCASKQNKYPELERVMTGYYCNSVFKGDPTVLTDSEIAGCKYISDHYGKPLTQGELDVSVTHTDINSEQFYACYKTSPVLYNNAKNFASELGVTRTGVYLVDCRVTADLPLLAETICGLHPDLAPCKSLRAADTNSGYAADQNTG